MSQKNARTKGLAARRRLTGKYRREASAAITASICTNQHFIDAQKVALYSALDDEVDVTELRQITPTKSFYLPVLQPPGALAFARVHADTALEPNRFGIPEPDLNDTACIAARELDFVIVPLSVFDDGCNRIGMGGGYYDRAFAFMSRDVAAKRPCLAGVAFDVQRIESIAPHRWDIPLDLVFTESTLIERASA